MAKILTGVQSTGTPHLGNLLGAIIPSIQMANKSNEESYFFIANLHSLTQIKDPKVLQKNTFSTAAAWLSFGLDTNKACFFKQSDVSEVTELAWHLSCFFPYQRLTLAHSFKDKSDNLKDVNAGLFSYPMLMAADILLYDSTHVPVGEDQKQHLELSRDIAQKFNLDFKAPDFLKAPEPLIQKNFARIMSLKDGTKKMSKSDPSDLSRINLTDKKDEIVNKIKKAKTDNSALPSDDKKLNERPEVENLLGIYSSLSNQTLSDSINEFGGKNFSEFKQKLSDLVVAKISPISDEINKLKKDNNFIDKILEDGAEKADKITSKKVKEMKKIIGF